MAACPCLAAAPATCNRCLPVLPLSCADRRLAGASASSSRAARRVCFSPSLEGQLTAGPRASALPQAQQIAAGDGGAQGLGLAPSIAPLWGCGDAADPVGFMLERAAATQADYLRRALFCLRWRACVLGTGGVC